MAQARTRWCRGSCRGRSRTMTAEERINRAVSVMKAKVEALKGMNRKASEARRYRSGTFNFTKDRERSYQISALESVIKAFDLVEVMYPPCRICGTLPPNGSEGWHECKGVQP